MSFELSYNKPKKSKSVIRQIIGIILLCGMLYILVYNVLLTLWQINLDNYIHTFVNLDFIDTIKLTPYMFNYLYDIKLKSLLIVLALFLILRFNYGLTFNNIKISFQPLSLKWKIMTSFQIISISQKENTRDILTYLRNNPRQIVTYQIIIESEKTRMKLYLEEKRYILPPSYNKIKSRVRGISNLLNIEIEQCNIKNKKRYKKYPIKFKQKLPDLNKLSIALQTFSNIGCNIIVAGKYVGEKQIKLDPKFHNFIFEKRFQKQNILRYQSQTQKTTSFYKISLEIELNKKFKNRIIEIEAILKSLVEDVKIKKFGNASFTKSIEIKYVHQILRIPNIPYLMKINSNITNAPTNEFKPEKIIGSVLINNRSVSPFGINLSDFNRGGIICGAIGNGKTTLRLHILKFLLSKNIRTIDFDIKGDGPRFAEIGSKGKILVPNLNFSINPFKCPKGFTKEEYIGILNQTFLETIPNKEDLSPPQIHLLTKAIRWTVEMDGNSRTFFRNILSLGHAEKIVIDNFQDSSAHALITKFSWFQTIMRDVFWREDNSIREEDFINSSLFFDLSLIKRTAPIHLIRFLINLILTQIIAFEKNSDYKNIPKLMVFLDEAQLLMPINRDKELTRLEEIVTTLRYKGISVIAAGVSAEIMSQILLDTGFIAQYHSESTKLSRSLGLQSEKAEIINSLPIYTSLISSQSSGQKPIHVAIDNFDLKQDNFQDYEERIANQNLIKSDYLPKYELDFQNFNRTKIFAGLPRIHNLKNSIYDDFINSAQDFLKTRPENLWDLFQSFSFYNLIEFLYNSVKYWLKEVNLYISDVYFFEFIQIIIQEWILFLFEEFNQYSKVNKLKNDIYIILSKINKETINFENKIKSNEWQLNDLLDNQKGRKSESNSCDKIDWKKLISEAIILLNKEKFYDNIEENDDNTKNYDLVAKKGNFEYLIYLHFIKNQTKVILEKQILFLPNEIHLFCIENKFGLDWYQISGDFLVNDIDIIDDKCILLTQNIFNYTSLKINNTEIHLNLILVDLHSLLTDENSFNMKIKAKKIKIALKQIMEKLNIEEIKLVMDKSIKFRIDNRSYYDKLEKENLILLSNDKNLDRFIIEQSIKYNASIITNVNYQKYRENSEEIRNWLNSKQIRFYWDKGGKNLKFFEN